MPHSYLCAKLHRLFFSCKRFTRKKRPKLLKFCKTAKNMLYNIFQQHFLTSSSIVRTLPTLQTWKPQRAIGRKPMPKRQTYSWELRVESWGLRGRQMANTQLYALRNPTLNSQTQTATGNVFPCVAASARYRGSGEPASRRGWPSAAKRLFRKFGKTATLMLTELLRFLRKHLPYPRYRAAEEDIARLPISPTSQP